MQEMQEQMRSMNDSGELQEVESNHSGRLSYVPSQPAAEFHSSTFFAALNSAVIDTVMGHVNVHIDCHLMNCDASLCVSSGEPALGADVCQGASRMRRNYGDAAAHHNAQNTQQHTRTYQHQQQAH